MPKYKNNIPPGAHEVYVYRMTITNDEGYEIDYSWDKVKHRCIEMGVNHVPELGRLIFRDTFREKFLKIADKFVDGDSTLDSTHIREGVVVRADGSIFMCWKYKNFSFKVLENIIKLDAIAPDIEESQEV